MKRRIDFRVIRHRPWLPRELALSAAVLALAPAVGAATVAIARACA